MNKQKILSVIKSSISLVNQFDPKLPLEVQCEKHGLLQSLKITAKQFNIFPTKNKRAIGIRNLFEYPQLRLTVYYLEKGTIMKLHDHNQMHVVSTVLSGKMQAKLYRLKNKKQGTYQKTTKTYTQNTVFYIDGKKTYDMHQFIALQPTFFLDIIFPDYNPDNDCHFYAEKTVISQNQVVLEKVNHDEIVFEDI